jgi:hypothetical protein
MAAGAGPGRGNGSTLNSDGPDWYPRLVEAKTTMTTETDFSGPTRGETWGEPRTNGFVADVLRTRFGIELTPVKTTRRSKTTDFRYDRDGKLAFSLEVKEVVPDLWLPTAGAPGRVNYANCLSEDIHTAFKQFMKYAPNAPKVLVFVNRNDLMDVHDLDTTVRGGFRLPDGSRVVDPDGLKAARGRIRDEKFAINVYLWIDAWKDPYSIQLRRPVRGVDLRGYFPELGKATSV